MSIYCVRSGDSGGVLRGEQTVSQPLSSSTLQHHPQREDDGTKYIRRSSTFSSLISVNCLLLQDYYSSGRMLVRMAQAIGRLVLAGRELTRLAG